MAFRPPSPGAVRAGIDSNHTFLNHVGNKAVAAGGGNQISALLVEAKSGLCMAYCYGGVERRLLHQYAGHRLAQNVAPADNYHVSALGLYAVFLQQNLYSECRAGSWLILSSVADAQIEPSTSLMGWIAAKMVFSCICGGEPAPVFHGFSLIVKALDCQQPLRCFSRQVIIFGIIPWLCRF